MLVLKQLTEVPESVPVIHLFIQRYFHAGIPNSNHLNDK